MRVSSKHVLLGIGIAAAAMFALPPGTAWAQTAPLSAATTPTAPLIKALQVALTRQGIAVNSDGVLTDQTRAAIRTYQSQHHLPVTGEPDKATLDKLGVRTSEAQSPTQAAPAQPGQTAQGGMHGGMMMNCPMMQGQMTAMMQMMQMMQGMMGMMQTMQEQMPGRMQPGQMQPGQMQPGQTGPMQRGSAPDAK